MLYLFCWQFYKLGFIGLNDCINQAFPSGEGAEFTRRMRKALKHFLYNILLIHQTSFGPPSPLEKALRYTNLTYRQTKI